MVVLVVWVVLEIHNPPGGPLEHGGFNSILRRPNGGAALARVPKTRCFSPVPLSQRVSYSQLTTVHSFIYSRSGFVICLLHFLYR